MSASPSQLFEMRFAATSPAGLSGNECRTSEPSSGVQRHSGTTPEPHLHGYLEQLESEMNAVSASIRPDSYDAGSAFLKGYTAQSSLSPDPAQLRGRQDSIHRPYGADSSTIPPLGLPLGPEAPKYRPSPQPRSTTGVSRDDGRLAASPSEALLSLLKKLDVTEIALDVWTERFREWMATVVLQPLVAAAEAASANVVASTQAAGWQGVKLTALGGNINRSHGARHLHGEIEADDQMMISQIFESLNAKQRSNMLTNADMACFEALNSYMQLSKLLNGDYLNGLLPAAPRGYIAARVRTLAESTCMMAFEWNKGGDFMGRPWSNELPTDSALVLYLFAAYVTAPRWEWPTTSTSGKGSRAGPLYVGALPARPAEQFTAILPVRPASLHKGGVAILGLSLASANPHFSLLLEGEIALTLTGPNAVFHTILLFLQYIRRYRFSMLGEHHLDYRQLDLAWVIEDIDDSVTAAKSHW
eukprot:CAMPEP_0177781044 /NCGR_PEP_ID=MMETSP0491_2-20121128/17599_1 /TAXON_ID=63592 /ORGANISM="Tetraselmis chuii, Strain PLY429" /LENGTH=472 /DNA_ID=CAMNT_0019301001 /DNA_START=142 /DNA_END=1557 /DNA_ORIENTATION=+